MRISKHIICVCSCLLFLSAALVPLPGKNAAAAATLPKVIAGKEGFWRIGQDDTGVFWFVSPQGTCEFLNTVTTVQPSQDAGDGVSPGYRSVDWKGDIHEWAQKTVVRLRQFGFKGIGAWSNQALFDCKMPFTVCLNLSLFSKTRDRQIFSPQWAAAVEKAVRDQVVPLKDNSYLVGYFPDNELAWSDQGVGPRVYFDGLATDDPNRLELIGVIKTLWPNVSDFNKDWHVNLADWSGLQKLSRLPDGAKSAYSRLLSTWLGHVSLQYFRITTGAIRRYDPNHLILGVRYQGCAVSEVVRSSRGYTDVQSINIYAGDSRLDPRTFKMISDESRQPVLITEFSFHALDGRSGNLNRCDFPAQVADQKARAEGYRLFVSRLAAVPYIVGADWFQWMDEPPHGRGDGEDANVGMVDIYDQPYQLLIDAVKETAPQLNKLHAEAVSNGNKEIWRSIAAE